MSYQVIARKWRPQRFDDVTGQEHVTTPLRNAIRTDRVPHAILLTGPRGTGKTTLARIVAKCLNCEKGPTDEPCGSCASCTEIAEGRSTDVQEIDAASRTSVDDVRELIEAIRYAAAPGRHKIFVVDEVHMLSTAAFNALLKTLEEPPPRSLFLFATTNPEKIPFTVISRCQRYDLRRIARVEIAACLGHIAKSEGVEISESSLLAIAREGDGSMRDAQTLLDQIIAYGGSQVSDETVGDVLDLIDRRILLAILGACVDSDPAAVLEACARANEAGADPKRLASDLVLLLRDLVVLRVAPDAPGLVEGAEDEIQELIALAARTEAVRLRRMFRALIKEQEDLTWAPQPGAVLEMALLRLASLPSGDEVAALLSRLESLEQRLAGGGGGRGPGGGGRPTAGESSTARGGPAPRTSRSAPERTGLAQGVATGTAEEAIETELPSPPATATDTEPASVEAPPIAASAPATDAPLSVVYDRLRGFAQEANRGLFASLDGGRLVAREADRLQIALRGRFHVRRIQDRAAELETICERFFGRPTRIEVLLDEDEPAPPPRPAKNAPRDTREASAPPKNREDPRERENVRRLRQAALEHPAINTAIRELQGEIVEIHPLGEGSRT